MKLFNRTPLRSLRLLLLICTGSLFAIAGVKPGQPAPEFTCTDIAGQTHRLSSYRGKMVVLEWINPACPFVLRHYRSGNMQSTQAAALAAGAVWLQINSNAMGDLEASKSVEWQKKQGSKASAYIRDESGSIGRLYGALTTPHVYLIGRDGALIYQGAIDDQPNASQATTTSAHNYLLAALNAAKAGDPIAKSATDPYGCSIKYGEASKVQP